LQQHWFVGELQRADAAVLLYTTLAQISTCDCAVIVIITVAIVVRCGVDNNNNYQIKYLEAN
jgi:hypothetical protein